MIEFTRAFGGVVIAYGISVVNKGTTTSSWSGQTSRYADRP